MSVSVIIPTIGTPLLSRAVQSVLNQTYTNVQCYIVVDGCEHLNKVPQFSTCKIQQCVLPYNVGGNGFYGHRIYAAFSHLMNTDYVMYLDEDNWMEPNHIETCVHACVKGGHDWVYSLRNIYVGQGDYLCRDDCESLGKWPSVYGYNFVDTNSYLLKTEVAKQVCGAWHGQWGQDRVFYNAVSNAFPNFACSGMYTINYTASERLRDFFIQGNCVTGHNKPWSNDAMC